MDETDLFEITTVTKKKNCNNNNIYIYIVEIITVI